MKQSAPSTAIVKATKPTYTLADPVAAASEAFAKKTLNWSGVDWRPLLSLPPRERMQAWLGYVQSMYHDDTIPKFAFSCEVDGGLHIVSTVEHENLSTSADAPRAPCITRAVFGMTTPFAMVNGLGTLHGGYAGVVLDRCSALLLVGACRQNFWEFSAVSTALTLYWDRPVSLGEQVEIEVEFETINKNACELIELTRVL